MTPRDCPLCRNYRSRPHWRCRRLSVWGWLLVALCLAGAAVCVYLMVTR